MEQTITPEERDKKNASLREAKHTSLVYPADNPSWAISHLQGLVDFAADEIDRVRQEALAQGWAACEKEIVYKGHYFNECEGWLHVDMKDIANPHRNA